MTHAQRLGLLAALSLTLAGCLPAHLPLAPASEGRHLEITGVEAPPDARTGEAVTVQLKARLYGSCWRVGEARAAVDGAARTVTLGGTAQRAEGACDAKVREESVAVTFTPLAAGTYRLEVPYGITRARLERTIRVLD